ncbi:alkali-sensitive linkage protein 1-like [Haliotis rubra]|uniref:alkali-sensitive linkage protein 1-like n=1 Tax=Haliotis rubra TaxID=36100 RepID=UPI001EE60FD5|nr:alkali-sensitive linkage protein 1-like [Haliotis rubra]
MPTVAVQCETMFTGGFILLSLVVGACGSAKKGVGIPSQGFRCEDLLAFPNVHWWYDWFEQPTYQHNCKQNKAGRVPMIWGWRQNVDFPLHIPSNAHYILGFNEPNFSIQANLSPQLAADHWRLIERAGQGKLLVSPAAAPCSGNPICNYDGIQWFEEFFRHCAGCKVDYIATHAYWCSADTTMNYLQTLYNKFHKKIWLTEFACPSHNSVQDQLNYMKAILPRLEAASYVSRYAWFASRWAGDSFVTQASSLLDQSTSTLTSLGKYYNNF